MPLEWNQSWSVGVECCDRDHKKLFELANDLDEAMRVGKGAQVVDLVVDELTRYARLHFANEEGLMTRTNYPGLPAHRAEHQKFTEEVAIVRKDIAEGHITHSVTVSGFLYDWLQNHIRKSDKAYSAHLNASGIR